MQSEVVRMTEQVSGAQQRLEEREASAGREQARADALLESLRAEHSHVVSNLEERCVHTHIHSYSITRIQSLVH